MKLVLPTTPNEIREIVKTDTYQKLGLQSDFYMHLPEIGECNQDSIRVFPTDTQGILEVTNGYKTVLISETDVSRSHWLGLWFTCLMPFIEEEYPDCYNLEVPVPESYVYEPTGNEPLVQFIGKIGEDIEF